MKQLYKGLTPLSVKKDALKTSILDDLSEQLKWMNEGEGYVGYVRKEIFIRSVFLKVYSFS